VIGLLEELVVGASSRSKILGEALVSRLMGLRKRRLAIAGPGPVDVVVGDEFVLADAGSWLPSSVLSWSLDVDWDLGLEPQSIAGLGGGGI
jgi:hypothetical protein